jgi:DNA primase
LLLEGGFEAKVLALPGGLDPDSFVRKKGAPAYRQLLATAPPYIDYLTERALATHGTETPEARVAVVNAIAPYVAKIPNSMLRGELANRLATRLRIDDRLVREELMRAAGVLKGEIHPQRDVYTSEANHAVKQLLKACLANKGLADELVPRILESGACEGLLGEQVFKQLAELHQRGEKLDLTRVEESLRAEERRLLYESLFWAGETADRDLALRHLRSLIIRKAQREGEKLVADIKSAAASRDNDRLALLQQAKQTLDKQLRELLRPEKNLTPKRTD